MIAVKDGKSEGKCMIHIEGSPHVVLNEWANLTRELACLLIKEFGEELVKESMKRLLKEARKDAAKQAREEKNEDAEMVYPMDKLGAVFKSSYGEEDQSHTGGEKEMRLKGRYVPDDKIEIAPYVVDIPRGEGMTQLMVLGPEEQPKKEIECFHLEWPEPQKGPKTWVWVSVLAASIVGSASVFTLFFAPKISTALILASLGWLCFVAFANRR